MRKSNEELKKIIMEKAPGSRAEKEEIFNHSFKNWVEMHAYIYKKFNIDFDSKILDIGSSYGHNLIHFRKNSVGIEINPRMIAFSESLGLKIMPINVEDSLKSVNQKFNLIWCTDFLVHLMSPYKFLYDCRDLLEDKGRLVVQIPLMSVLNAHRSSCHPYAFNRKSLAYLMEMTGYKIIKTSGLVRKKSRWFNSIFEPLLQLFGGNIWILAEKKDTVPLNFNKVFLPKWFKH